MNLLQHLTLDVDGWESLKSIICKPEVSEKVISVDEKNKIIVAMIENEISVIGYAYPQYQEVKDDLIYSLIYNDLKNIYGKMMQLIKENNYKAGKTMIVTPLRLSSYPGFDLAKLPDKFTGYTYLSEYPNLNKKTFALKLDEQIWRYHNQNS